MADHIDSISGSQPPKGSAKLQGKDSERTGKTGRRARRFLREVTYPHSIHPALVPGVSVGDQKITYRVDRPIVVVVGGLVVAFVIWGILAPQNVFAVSSAALSWVMANLGWVFTVLAIGLVIVLLCLAFSRFGAIPLGLDGEKPEYSTLSWAAMLFAAGIGIAIIFFGPFEPMSHYLDPRPGAYEPASTEAVVGALSQSALHWGINAWADLRRGGAHRRLRVLSSRQGAADELDPGPLLPGQVRGILAGPGHRRARDHRDAVWHRRQPGYWRATDRYRRRGGHRLVVRW